MAAFIVRRLLAAVILLVVVSMMTFAIFFLVPRLAGMNPDQLALRYVGRGATAESIQATKERLHLDDPLPVQYGRFVQGIVVGRRVQLRPGDRQVPAALLRVLLPQQPAGHRPAARPHPGHRCRSRSARRSSGWSAGVSIGVLSALRRGSVFDRAAMSMALAGVSLPIYFTGLLSLALFAYHWKLWPNGVNYVPFTENPLDWAYNLILPWVTLAFLYAALYARLTRASMLETMSEDYIRTARAKGLRERTVVVKHGMRAP